MSTSHEAPHASDSHAHGHAHEEPAEARETIADFAFYASATVAAAALLLQAFVGDYGAPRHAPADQHEAAAAHGGR